LQEQIVGSGISYYDIEDIVETIVNMKKRKYNFPGTDPEDLAQDIRLICWESLKKFDSAKLGKSVFHFVARCTDNALYNKFRGVFLDNNPPCLRCPDYIKETKGCKIDEVGCDRIVSYRDRMARKRAIAAPLSYNAHLDSDTESDFTHHKSMSVGSATGVCDLNNNIRQTLDNDLIPYYDRLIHGDDIPTHYRKMIQQQIKLLLEKLDE